MSSPSSTTRERDVTILFPKALSLTALNLLLCSSTLLCMTPVYGSIPTFENYSNFWKLWIIGYITLGISWTCSPNRPGLLVVLVCCLPLFLQFCCFPLSSQLGPAFGPFVTEVMVLGPLHVHCVYVWIRAIASALEHDEDEGGHCEIAAKLRWAQPYSSGLLAFALHGLTMKPAARLITHGLGFQVLSGYNWVTRSRLIHASTFGYVLLWRKALPRAQLVACVSICVLSLVLFGGSTSLAYQFVAKNKLDRLGYRIIDSMDSNTGYVSVLQNVQSHFQVLRNDHSLLGGIWLPNPKNGLLQPETVYPVFAMLEAVRLIECEDCETNKLNPSRKKRKSALVIGLGIGTAPAALSLHGIHTTVVEIDPAIIHLARKHFALPQSVTVINEDAIKYLKAAVAKGVKYDYVIHDVFTGGAEPAHLFTAEFIRDVYKILEPSGSVAVNYAGDIRKDSTRIVLNTICHVFQDCRAFRDSQPEENSHADTINMMVYAHASEQNWHFRKAEEADFLGSAVRQKVLPPRMELDIRHVGARNNVTMILSNSNVREFSKGRHAAACDHWAIMRKVIPAPVWEMY